MGLHRLDAIARRVRIELAVVAQGSIEAQKAVIARGGCYAIFGRQTTWQELAGGDLARRTIVETRVPRLLVITTSRHRPPGSATREVLLHLRRIHCFAKTS